MCGVLIGAYEPLKVRADGVVRTSSIASDPRLSPMVGEHYHQDCYDLQLEDYALVSTAARHTRLRLVQTQQPSGGRLSGNSQVPAR
jgi:hypothetical protein